MAVVAAAAAVVAAAVVVGVAAAAAVAIAAVAAVAGKRRFVHYHWLFDRAGRPPQGLFCAVDDLLMIPTVSARIW